MTSRPEPNLWYRSDRNALYRAIRDEFATCDADGDAEVADALYEALQGALKEALRTRLTRVREAEELSADTRIDDFPEQVPHDPVQPRPPDLPSP